MKVVLEAQFNPTLVEIFDDSNRHAGHAGHSGQGETHYRITLVSRAFEGQRSVDRQRRIYAALAEEFKRGLHALELSALTPDEAERKRE